MSALIFSSLIALVQVPSAGGEAADVITETEGKGDEQGSVTVTFVVDVEGGVSDCIVIRSSGFVVLDRASCQAVLGSAPAPVEAQLSTISEPRHYKMTLGWALR